LYSIYTVKIKKLGGEGKEVMIDFLKLHLRNKKNRNEEHLVLGFIEKNSGRARGYLIPNIKPHTIVQFLAKTVASKSVLYTPFYA